MSEQDPTTAASPPRTSFDAPLVIHANPQGDYAALVRALGGQVVKLRRAPGFLDVLDAGAATPAAGAGLGRSTGAAVLAQAAPPRTAVLRSHPGRI